MQDHKKSRPSVVITGSVDECYPCAVLHFQKLKKFYRGHIHIVNLVDSAGSQAQLQGSYEHLAHKINEAHPEMSLEYTHFNYHKEV